MAVSLEKLLELVFILFSLDQAGEASLLKAAGATACARFATGAALTNDVTVVATTGVHRDNVLEPLSKSMNKS